MQEYTNGSQEAFARLVRTYTNLVYKVCLGETGGDALLAEDAAQAVFWLLARKAEGMEEDVNLPVWLIRTARYVSRRMRRSEETRRRYEDAYAKKMRDGRLREATVEEKVERKEMWTHVEKALEHLPADMRDAVVLHYMVGKNWKEVGESLGCSEEAARKKGTRGIERLRALLARGGVVVGVGTLVDLFSPGADAAGLERVEEHILDVCLRGREVPPRLAGVLRDAGGTHVFPGAAVKGMGLFAHVGAWGGGALLLGAVSVLGVLGVKMMSSRHGGPAASGTTVTRVGEVVGGVVGVGECTLVRGDVRKVVRLRDEVREGDVLEVARGVLAMKGKGGGFVAAAEGSKVKVLGEGEGGRLRVQLLAGRVEVEGKVDLVGSSSGSVKASGTARRMWEERGGSLVEVTGRYATMLFLRDYMVVDLGTLGGPVKAYDVNDKGMVVGYCGRGGGERAFVWRSGRMNTLKGLERARARARDINDRGEIVGFVRLGGRNEAFAWFEGKTRILPRGSFREAGARGVNEVGDVVGYVVTKKGKMRSAVWWEGRELALLPGNGIYAVDDEGGVYYCGKRNEKGRYAPWRFRREGVPRMLHVPDGYEGGVVLGFAAGGAVGMLAMGGGGNVAAMWKDGHCERLGEKFLPFSSSAVDVNGRGWVVGAVEGKRDAHPFVWDGVTAYDLSSLVKVPKGAALRNAVAVNDHNRILVNGMLKGKRRAFLLVPRESSVGRKEVSRET